MNTIVAEVRFAESADASSLASAHASAWRGAYGGIIPHRTLNAMIGRRGDAWWRQAITSQAAILVIEFAGVVAGYATLGRNRTPELAVGGEIYEIYLRPEYQGVGLGKRLFSAARALLQDRGFRGAAVWALADNQNALRFYDVMGGADIAEGEERFEGVTLRKIAFTWH